MLYSTKWVKSTTRAQHNHTTTQPQHTTTNMSRCRSSSGFGPLPPWAGQRRHQIMAPPLPMGPIMTPAIGCALAAPLFLVWGIETQPIKKQRGGWGLGLRWPPFYYGKQQSTESWHSWWRRYQRGRATAAECVGGARCNRLGRRMELQKNK